MNMDSEIVQVRLDDILPNRFQPRLNFDEQALNELAASIKEHGIIQPLVLRKLGDKYEIIAGERRYKASILAGLSTVPAVISNIDDNKSAEVALVENLQRRDLTPIEEAKSYKVLLDRGYLTQDDLAKKMGISQSNVANKLRLLNLTDEVQQALLEQKISERHARALLVVPKEEQKEWLDKIINSRLTVRQLDEELKKKYKSVVEDDETTESSDAIVKVPTETPIMDIDTVKKEDVQPDEPTNPDNKFFNYLEDEAADLTIENEETEKSFNPNINEPAVENAEEEVDIFSPTADDFFNTKPSSKPQEYNETTNDNTLSIFETPSDSKEIVDPVNSIDNLKEQPKKEETNFQINSAINVIREAVKIIENAGYRIENDEADFEDIYQITIKIEK